MTQGTSCPSMRMILDPTKTRNQGLLPLQRRRCLLSAPHRTPDSPPERTKEPQHGQPDTGDPSLVLPSDTPRKGNDNPSATGTHRSQRRRLSEGISPELSAPTGEKLQTGTWRAERTPSASGRGRRDLRGLKIVPPPMGAPEEDTWRKVAPSSENIPRHRTRFTPLPVGGLLDASGKTCRGGKPKLVWAHGNGDVDKWEIGPTF